MRWGARWSGSHRRRPVRTCIRGDADDPDRHQSIDHRRRRRLTMNRHARHCRRTPERQRNFVAPGIARLEVRTLDVFVLVHDRLGVIMTGDTVLMFRVVVPQVRVRVQAGHLTGRRQQGHPHEERKRALHAPECIWKRRLAVNAADLTPRRLSRRDGTKLNASILAPARKTRLPLYPLGFLATRRLDIRAQAVSLGMSLPAAAPGTRITSDHPDMG